MEILYICSTYIPASGGSEISSHTVLKELVKMGHKCTVITFSNDNADMEQIDGVQIHRISVDSPFKYIKNICNKKIPSFILTSLGWSDVAILFAKSKNIPVGLFIHALDDNLDISAKGKYSVDLVFSNSEFTRKKIREQFGIDSLVLYPAINLSEYRAKGSSHKYITMINPIDMKGGLMFKSIAKMMPKSKFLAKVGWRNLRKNGTWDIRKLNHIAKTYKAKLLIPEEHSIVLPNIWLVNNELTMNEIYGLTKILLVPSIYEETFCRVIIEAMSNSIPVIASNIGGIPEAMGGAGILIDDFLDVNNWMYKINKLTNDKKYYKQLSSECKKRAGRYDYVKEVKKLEKAMMAIL